MSDLQSDRFIHLHTGALFEIFALKKRKTIFLVLPTISYLTIHLPVCANLGTPDKLFADKFVSRLNTPLSTGIPRLKINSLKKATYDQVTLC